MTPALQSPAGTADWSISVGKATGSGHRLSGVPYQDDAFWRPLNRPGSWVTAVSDGAGSGRLSHYAAAVAVRSACHFLQQEAACGPRLLLAHLRAAAERATADILRLAAMFEGVGPVPTNRHDFACTFILVALTESRLLMLQVGDGALVVRCDGALRCLSPQSNFEYANEAIFLTSAPAMHSAAVEDLDASRISGIAVMSDGVQRLTVARQTNEPLAGFFDPMFAYADGAKEVAAEERNNELNRVLNGEVVSGGNEDDKTLVLAVRPID